MFEAGDVIFLPLSFGTDKRGVLVRKEPDGRWLIQIGTSGYAYLPEKELRPITRISSCWKCGALLNDSMIQRVHARTMILNVRCAAHVKNRKMKGNY